MKHDTTFDKIDAWLSGELAEAEARAFEAEMAADTDLATAVRQRRIARLAIDRLVEQDFERNIAKWRTEMHDLPEPPAPWWRRRFIWAVLLLLPLAGAFWFYMRDKPTSESNRVEQEDIPPVAPRKNDDPALNPPNNPPLQPAVREPIAQASPMSEQQKLAIGLAGARLQGYPGAVLTQYDHTLGAGDRQRDAFVAGREAFQKAADASLQQAAQTRYRQEARRNLLRVPSTDNHYTAAQEMLAWLFFQEGNYAEAARRYDLYADQDKASIVTDWWRLQFYLADYPNRKADFQALLEEVLDPAKPHQYASRAAELKAAVEAIEAENN